MFIDRINLFPPSGSRATPQEDVIPDIESLTQSTRSAVTVEASDLHGEVAPVGADEADGHGPSEALQRFSH